MSDHTRVTPEVSAALGKTQEEIAAMTLREFFMLAHYKGFDVRMNPTGGQINGLTVTEGCPAGGEYAMVEARAALANISVVHVRS